MRSLLLALLLAPARAQDNVPSPGAEREVESVETDETRRVAARLSSDPDAAAALAARILRSSISERLSAKDSDEAAAFRQVRDWISKEPDSAANLAIGFAKDDATGTDSFERSLKFRLDRLFKLSPDRYRGLFGQLKGMSMESRRLTAGRMDDDDTREALKRFFEGKDDASGKVRARSEQASEAGSRPPAAASAAAYDRLSAGNLKGYSPHVQAYQNAMNLQKVPGAPPLPETGRIDYPTLRHPYYGLRYDVDRLKAAAPGSSRLAAAEAAVAAFAAEAERAKAPGAITRELLRSLSDKRQTAARWITAVSVEEQRARLASRRGFPDRGMPAEAAALRRRLEAALALADEALAALGDARATAAAAGLDKKLKLLRGEARALPAAIDQLGLRAPVRSEQQKPLTLWERFLAWLKKGVRRLS